LRPMATMREQMKKSIGNTEFYAMVIGVGGAAGLVHYPLGLMVLILLSWGVITIAIGLVIRWRVRCPNCHTMLGAKGRAILKEKPSLDNCPHCGVNFDQQL
jgi:hypothetical protein